MGVLNSCFENNVNDDGEYQTKAHPLGAHIGEFHLKLKIQITISQHLHIAMFQIIRKSEIKN